MSTYRIYIMNWARCDVDLPKYKGFRYFDFEMPESTSEEAMERLKNYESDYFGEYVNFYDTNCQVIPVFMEQGVFNKCEKILTTK